MIKEIEVDGVRHSIQAENTIKVTWAELKALRDEAKLNAGTFYRITDYVTTTTQSETKSANHPFDVIVLALSENTLSEDAKAALHEGDTYFADSDLSAWELKYCLDNDRTRFSWVDETNGKGVIYRMVDEKRNDCPYDFKNILFYNTTLTSGTTSDKYYYTFSYVVSGVLYDGTTEKQVRLCYGNVMGECHNSGVLQLNKNVFRNTSFGNSCYSNTFGKSCNRNTFGDTCYSNTFGIDNGINTFGNYCNSNTFGDTCYSNTFGNSCYSNTFGNYCNSNTFGDTCYSNTFGNSCNRNTFGDYCGSNTFGNSLQNHSLNSGKTSITLNEEFYDDGSGQLVPTKHPDLSTQPSILPYKFMGQYVYEQLIPIYKDTKLISLTGGVDFIPAVDPLSLSILDVKIFAVGKTDRIATSKRIFEPVSFNIASDYVKEYDPRRVYTIDIVKLPYAFSIECFYVRLVYTSMPEEGDYYGYNEY